MRLENIVWEMREPQRVGALWAGALGAEVLTDTPDLVEARLTFGDALFLDLCFPRVDRVDDVPQRLWLELAPNVPTGLEGGERCVRARADAGQDGSGPIASVVLESADPERDARFWAGVTGWQPAGGVATLGHPSGRGPLLELTQEREPRRGKSTLHLDVRPDDGDADPVGLVVRLGGRVLDQPAPDLPWTVCVDPSGNEVCLLGVGQGDQHRA